MRNFGGSALEPASSRLAAAQALSSMAHDLKRTSYNIYRPERVAASQQSNQRGLAQSELLTSKYHDKKYQIEQERQRRAKLAQVRVMQQHVVMNKNKIIRLQSKHD